MDVNPDVWGLNNDNSPKSISGTIKQNKGQNAFIVEVNGMRR